jgi:hypothetical protein
MTKSKCRKTKGEDSCSLIHRVKPTSLSEQNDHETTRGDQKVRLHVEYFFIQLPLLEMKVSHKLLCSHMHAHTQCRHNMMATKCQCLAFMKY